MATRSSVMLEQDQIDDLKDQFESLDANGDGLIDLDELGTALAICGVKLPNYKVREIAEKSVKKFDVNQDGKIDTEEFKRLYAQLKREMDPGLSFKKSVSARQGIQQKSGTTEGSSHTVKDSENTAFSSWINRKLKDDPDCKHLLPVDPDSDDLFKKVKDGILLCKLINNSVLDTIDERTINKTKLNVYLRLENHNLALNSAQAIGCNVVNIGHADLDAGTPHLVLGLLWQIIRIGLLSEINLQHNPGLVKLLEEGETYEDLMKLSPEEILIRWVNYHLRNANANRQISNFSGDIKDSEAYIYLLNQISPEHCCSLDPLPISDLENKAESMLMEADKIGCRAFITYKDVCKGNAKLNLAFVANLFNTYPALDVTEAQEIQIIEETREEKTYRNWMNSMGVNPNVNRLYSDLADGLILFQLYEVIKAGCVDWDKVHKQFKKLKLTFEKIENCNYAVQLGKDLKFSLIGIAGKDIFDCNQTLTLALIWQLMRAYTLAVLSNMSEDGKPIGDEHIKEWVNNRLKEGGKTCKVNSFKDSSLKDGCTILHLIDCIAPKKVNWDNVKDTGEDKDNMLNAKYAISMGRKIGAKIYALPEDIVEVKQKMVMTIFACLMTVDWRKNQQAMKEQQALED